MKHARTEQLDKLEQALVQARQCQEPLHLSDWWVDLVMREIRHRRINSAPLPEMRYVVWRTAAVLALVTSLFVGLSLTWHAGWADTADGSVLVAEEIEDSTYIGGEP
jgi:hypothetical protein